MQGKSSVQQRPLRVLFWSGTFWPRIGGVEVQAASLLPALRNRGFEYIVVTPQWALEHPLESEYKGIQVFRFPFWKAYNDIDQVMQIRQQIAELKRSFAPHLIHKNIVGLDDFFYLVTANDHPAPLLVTLHGEWLAQTDPFTGRLLRGADWVVGCSAAILEKGRRLAREIEPRSSIIHNGVDVPSLLPTPLPTAAPQLLCLGRLHDDKGFDLVLEAFGSLIRRFPEARLVVAGDGPARAELERRVSELDLEAVVDLIGWVVPERVPALINATTVVLIPSRHESFGLVALEAALMARPVVGTRVGGLPEVVVHEQTGLLVEPEDSQALAEAAAWLLDHPQRAAQMGQVARERAQELFGWERCADAYEALYRRLIAGASRQQDKLGRDLPVEVGGSGSSVGALRRGSHG
jgi:glycogen(starch) synthase